MSLKYSRSVGVDGTGYPACEDVNHQTKSTCSDSLLIKHPSDSQLSPGKRVVHLNLFKCYL